MKSVVLKKNAHIRPASSLVCQRVGGCPFRTVVTFLVVASLLTAACLVCVWSRTEEYTQGYRNSEVADKLRELAQEQENLRVEIAGLRSPDRIESIARKQLGMKLPSEKQIRTVVWSSDTEDEVTTLAARRAR